MVLPTSHKVSRVSWYSGFCRCLPFSNTRLSLSLAGFPKTVLLTSNSLMQSITLQCTHRSLGSFPFARRYSGNRCFFLFLALLRCFSSGGSLHTAMYSLYDDWSSSSRVSPFGNQRIVGYLLLPAAYRSLSRPSSAPGAKASTLRSFLLDHFRVYSVTHWSGLFALCFDVLSYLKDNRLFRCLEYFLSIGFNVQFSRNNLKTDFLPAST